MSPKELVSEYNHGNQVVGREGSGGYNYAAGSNDRQTSLGFARIDEMERALFEPPPQQLQSVGDLIGRSIRIYRKNIKLFFHVLLWPTVFLTASKVAFHWGITSFSMRMDQKDWTMMGISGVVALLGVLSLLVVGLFLQLRQLSFIRLVTGFADNYADAYAFVMKRKWKIIGLIILAYIAIIVSVIFWSIIVSVCMAFFKANSATTYLLFAGMIFGLIGMAISVTVTCIALYFAFAVGACEDLSVGGLFSRTVSLVFQDFWRAGYFCTLLFIALVVISYPLSLPLLLVSIFEFMRQGMSPEFLTDPGKMPFYYTLFNQSWESIVSIITWPISFMATGLFYYDQRMRKEGIDLVRRIDLISQPATAIAEDRI